MEVYIKVQLLTTLYSSLFGVILGIIYDCFKIIRRFLCFQTSNKVVSIYEKIRFPLISFKLSNETIKTKHKIIYFIFDVLYFLFITPISLIFTYAVSDGIVRWYIILGATFGFAIYNLSVSKIILFVYEFIFCFFRIVLSYMSFFIKLPLNKIKICIFKILSKYKKKTSINRKKRVSKENKETILYSGKKITVYK